MNDVSSESNHPQCEDDGDAVGWGGWGSSHCGWLDSELRSFIHVIHSGHSGHSFMSFIHVIHSSDIRYDDEVGRAGWVAAGWVARSGSPEMGCRWWCGRDPPSRRKRRRKQRKQRKRKEEVYIHGHPPPNAPRDEIRRAGAQPLTLIIFFIT